MKVRSIEELGSYLREQRRNAELSLRQLAERAGVSNPYLSQVERGLRKPSAEVLSQLAKALSVSAEAMYVRAGLLDPDEAEDESDAIDEAVPRAIRADPYLTERHKRVLLEIYQSFRREAEAAEPASPSEPNEPPETRRAGGSGEPATGNSTGDGGSARGSEHQPGEQQDGRTTHERTETEEANS